MSVTFFEIRHRPLGFSLGVLAVMAACALVIFLVTMGRASSAETARLMQDLGFNILILPQGTDLGEFWAGDAVPGDMPEEYVQRLADTPGVGAEWLVATLQRRVRVDGHEALLTGVLPARPAVDAAEAAPPGEGIEPGRCHVGFALAEALGLREGGAVKLHGVTLRVERRLPEESTRDDIRIWAHLRDVQDALGMEGRINAIRALRRLPDGEPGSALRERITAVLPGVVVAELRGIAVARAQTRGMIERHGRFLIALAVVGCAAWVALLALLNVRERRSEIGLLRALGFGAGRIAALFLGRAALMGLVGAALGFALGSALAAQVGPEVFRGAVHPARPAYDLLLPTLLLAPLLAALAALPPALIAAAEDPAAILMEE